MRNSKIDRLIFTSMQEEWNRLETEENRYVLICSAYSGQFMTRYATEAEARRAARMYRDSDSDAMPASIMCNDVIIWQSGSDLTL